MMTTAPEEQSLLEELISIHHQAYLVTLEYPESEDASMVMASLEKVIVRMEAAHGTESRPL